MRGLESIGLCFQSSFCPQLSKVSLQLIPTQFITNEAHYAGCLVFEQLSHLIVLLFFGCVEMYAVGLQKGKGQFQILFIFPPAEEVEFIGQKSGVFTTHCLAIIS